MANNSGEDGKQKRRKTKAELFWGKYKFSPVERDKTVRMLRTSGADLSRIQIVERK